MCSDAQRLLKRLRGAHLNVLTDLAEVDWPDCANFQGIVKETKQAAENIRLIKPLKVNTA